MYSKSAIYLTDVDYLFVRRILHRQEYAHIVSIPTLLHLEVLKTLGTLRFMYLHRLTSTYTRHFPTHYQSRTYLIRLKFRSCTVPYLSHRLSIYLCFFSLDDTTTI